MPREPDRATLASHPFRRQLLATRPAFVLLALVAAGIGLATSLASGVSIAPLWAGLTLLGAATFHAAVNVHNDYFDDLNGTDPGNCERQFPFTGGSRMIQNGVMSRAATQRLAWALYAITIGIGLCLLVPGGLPLLALGLAGMVLGWAYSAPPLALNRRGLGEATVAAGFGLLMPVGADLVQRGEWHTLPVWAGLGFALMTANLLLINQFPDLLADSQAGKRHWVVRLGRGRARYLYLAIAAAAYLTPTTLVATNRLPGTTLIIWAALPLSVLSGIRLWRHHHQPTSLRGALAGTAAATLLYGGLLIVGLIAAG
ncbi:MULTISPECIES: prenyltransferase [unclassified Guyparkeria]|uniref:prenyltransferase n=1 Tax=unclassified Guyparkeria TaxID=2626246 RepID=UPI0007334F12|nr:MULTISPECIES: prenyltransferase [unclassified Guyparkeria]KTG17676.1 hypothetical protein AUR63_08545 [Guyparkeria sp. XI15]OAE88489.1 hypothetical protein AWR35_08560 [Guyparkeria sp. WRN-7]